MRKSPVLRESATGFHPGSSQDPVPDTHTDTEHTMEAERINLIGTTLRDLQERTVDLRRYL
ncbi:MAG: hypothetical protein PGN26_09125 [Xylophilus ampelinus]